MKRRLRILISSLKIKNLGGSLVDWILTLLAPSCTILAKAQIVEWKHSGELIRMRLRGLDGWLWFTSQANLWTIYMSIAEQTYRWQWHFYEIPETRVEDDIVIDVGCAEGIFPYLCAHRARKIFCFEPSPHFLTGLHKSFDGNSKIKIVPQALSSRCGQMYFLDRGVNSTLTNVVTNLPVCVTTLDAFCQENDVAPTYIKADLEGFEMEMLQGAREVICRNKPKIAITTYHRSEHAKQISEFLLSCCPSYKIKVKGIAEDILGPVMLHAW